MKILRTASLGSNFTGSYKKISVMHVDLIGVVDIFGTAKRLVFEGVDLKH